MSEVTINKWRQLKRELADSGLGRNSVTKFFRSQIVVVFGAKDTPSGRILSAKGKEK